MIQFGLILPREGGGEILVIVSRLSDGDVEEGSSNPNVGSDVSQRCWACAFWRVCACKRFVGGRGGEEFADVVFEDSVS